MNRSLLLLLLVFILGCAKADRALIYALSVPREESELTFSVVSDWKDDIEFRAVTSSCQGECQEFEPYSDETLDTILSVQFSSEDRELMLVTWVTGSAYRGQIFTVSPRGILELANVGSRAPPLLFEMEGNTVVLAFGVPRDDCLRVIRWDGINITDGEFPAFGPYVLCQPHE